MRKQSVAARIARLTHALRNAAGYGVLLQGSGVQVAEAQITACRSERIGALVQHCRAGRFELVSAAQAGTGEAATLNGSFYINECISEIRTGS